MYILYGDFASGVGPLEDKTMTATQKARDTADQAQARARAMWCDPTHSPAEQRAACWEAECAERQWENASRA